MSKRFTDSEKFRDTWYRRLSPKHKCLWEYMLSECSIAGVLEVDYDAMTFHIGDKIKPEDLDVFKDKYFYVTDDKIFIPNFIQFQQNGLNENNPAHKNIIKILKKYGINESLEKQCVTPPPKGLPSPISKGKGNSIGNGSGKGNSKYSDNFEDFWRDWEPYEMIKGEKKTTNAAYLKALKETDHETIIRKRNEYCNSCRARGSKTKYASSWLNANGWENDYPMPAPNSGNATDNALRDRVNETAQFIDNLCGDEGSKYTEMG